jgi:hypothetical protein
MPRSILSKTFFALLLIFCSCVEPYKPELNAADLEPQLVVEGRVTDEEGPFKVRLTNSGSVYTDQGIFNVNPVLNAEVKITDDMGNEYPLLPMEEGWYETPEKNLHGVPGNTYTLHITDDKGIKYESTPAFMPHVSPIDSVYYEEEPKTVIDGKNVSTENWLNILLNTQASGDDPKYFMWQFDETWEFNMPQNVELRYTVGISQYVWLNRDVDVIPEKLHCWVTEKSKSILIKSTAGNQVNGIQRFLLTAIAPDDDRFSIRYSILVKQFALTRELFVFFDKLKKLNETNGGIYDNVPAAVFGNISSHVENKSALGYFFASQVKTKRIFITFAQAPLRTGNSAYSACEYYPPVPYPPWAPYYLLGTADGGTTPVGSSSEYCADCRVRGTKTKPDFW